MPTPTNSLENHLERITCQEITYCASDQSLDDIALFGPPLVDVNDESRTIAGSLHLDLETVYGYTPPPTPTGLHFATREEALRGAIATTLVHYMHEITEWLKYDGERVFDNHGETMQEDFDLLGHLARLAAHTMLENLPRNLQKEGDRAE